MAMKAVCILGYIITGFRLSGMTVAPSPLFDIRGTACGILCPVLGSQYTKDTVKLELV